MQTSLQVGEIKASDEAIYLVPVLFSQHRDEFVSAISILSQLSRTEQGFSAKEEPFDITSEANTLPGDAH